MNSTHSIPVLVRSKYGVYSFKNKEKGLNALLVTGPERSATKEKISPDEKRAPGSYMSRHAFALILEIKQVHNPNRLWSTPVDTYHGRGACKACAMALNAGRIRIVYRPSDGIKTGS